MRTDHFVLRTTAVLFALGALAFMYDPSRRGLFAYGIGLGALVFALTVLYNHHTRRGDEPTDT